MDIPKVELPEGYEASVNQQTGVIILKPLAPKSVFERFKSIEDVVHAAGFTSLAQFTNECESISLSADEKNYRLVKMIGNALNEGWQPDWNNDNEAKYFPYFYMGGSSGFRYDDYDRWHSDSNVGSRLCFKSSKLAEYAGKTFTDVYKGFMLI